MPRDGERDQRRLGIGLQPLGLAEAALEGDDHLVPVQTQLLAQQARRLVALAVVGVAQQQRPVRQAVEAEHQALRPPVGLPVRLHARGQGGDVAWVVVVLGHEAQRRHAARVAGPLQQLVGDAGGGGRRVLRVHRQHQHLRHACFTQLVHHRGDAGVAVAHGVAHHEVVAARGELLGHAAACRAVHTASGEPSAIQTVAYLAAERRRPRAQDDAVQDRPPRQARDLDHARVAEEFGQVAAQRRGVGASGVPRLTSSTAVRAGWPWR